MDLAFHSLPSFKVMTAASHSIPPVTLWREGIYLSLARQDVGKLRVIMTSAGMIIMMTTTEKFEWIFTTYVKCGSPSEETQSPATHPSSPLHQPTFSRSMQNPSHAPIDHSVAVSPQASGQTPVSQPSFKWKGIIHLNVFFSCQSISESQEQKADCFIKAAVHSPFHFWSIF